MCRGRRAHRQVAEQARCGEHVGHDPAAPVVALIAAGLPSRPDGREVLDEFRVVDGDERGRVVRRGGRHRRARFGQQPPAARSRAQALRSRSPRPRATPRRPARAAGNRRSTRQAARPEPGSSSERSPSHASAGQVGDDRRVTRVADLGIRIGTLPSGQTASIVDVPGVGVGHATVWRDEPPPPAGRGIARTGVTVIDIGGNLFRSPVPAGGAVLNGAGECTGFITAAEWGLIETPIFLTSTMQVGRVYDAACELMMAEDPAIGARRRDHPGRRRVRRQLPQRVAPDAGQRRRREGGARGSQGWGRAVWRPRKARSAAAPA